MNYLKQLDAIRAIAVLLVIASHWLNLDIIHRLGFGNIGLDTFFVISGFLITRILFEHRLKAENLSLSNSVVLKNFYVRRSLRIFPIYYLTIFILLLISESTGTSIKSAFFYFLTYTANFYFYNRQSWDGIISHLWSLSIEEQFYLIWPWIILFSNKKYLLPIIIAFILAGVVSQWLLRGYSMFYVLTVTCFDCFGLGALLSWIIVFRRSQLDTFYKWVSVAAAVSILVYCTFVLLDTPTSVPRRSFTAIIALWIITYITRNTKNKKIKFGFILNNDILLFLGRISYGLYIYHHIIPRLVNSDFVKLKINTHLPDVILNHTGALLLCECALLLLVVAWASFVLIEKPFLRLKKYFDYEQVPTTQQAIGHT